MTDGLPALLLSGCLVAALAACGVADTEAGATLPEGAHDIMYTGELSYRQRVAVHPHTVAMVELRSAADDALVASSRLALEGRQVPVGFVLGVDADVLERSGEHVLRGSLLLDGRPTWLSEDVPVSVEAGEHALGTVWLQQAPADIGGFSARMICGDQPIAVSLIDGRMEVQVGEERFVMKQVPAASGARYVSVQAPDTGFWSRGERGLLEVRGHGYPECVALHKPGPAYLETLRATGNEPPWLLELAEGELRLILDYGETRISAPAPASVGANDAKRYRVDIDGAAIEMVLGKGPCADTMTGMPYPYAAVLRIDERELQGCAGDPASLLLGEAWRVAQIAGDDLPASSRVTMQFDDEGRVEGRGPCNSWGGTWTLSGEGLGIKEIVATMMACEPAVMARERALFDTLAAVYRFEIDADGTLILHAGDQRTIRALR